MEIDSATTVHDSPQGGGTKNGTPEAGGGAGKDYSSIDTVEGIKKDDTGELGNVEMDSGDVNMEASISADDVMRAGGFGARDDISNFLPVASDSTDFEASLRDARDYEEPQKEVCRPGLGWKDVKD